ncbi:MAG: hypothetical protein GY946_01785, partial [bacterium]|nr:hypothetical protein [bacterium]
RRPTARSRAETEACESLRGALADLAIGESVPDSEALDRFASALEWVLPEYLEEVYHFWKGEALDGVYPRVTRKIGAQAVELVGLAEMLSDWSGLPLRVRMAVRKWSDEIAWLQADVGEGSPEEVRRTPYDSERMAKEMHAVLERIDEIEWAFAIECGTRPPDCAAT